MNDCNSIWIIFIKPYSSYYCCPDVPHFEVVHTDLQRTSPPILRILIPRCVLCYSRHGLVQHPTPSSIQATFSADHLCFLNRQIPYV